MLRFQLIISQPECDLETQHKTKQFTKNVIWFERFFVVVWLTIASSPYQCGTPIFVFMLNICTFFYQQLYCAQVSYMEQSMKWNKISFYLILFSLDVNWTTCHLWPPKWETCHRFYFHGPQLHLVRQASSLYPYVLYK